jgi:hypothetical protein
MNRQTTAALLVSLLVAGAVQPAQACRFLPQRLSAEEQVAGATDVALVKVVRATPRSEPVPRRQPGTSDWLASYQGWSSAPADRDAERYSRRYPVEYQFEVEKRWRGPDRKVFTLMGISPPTIFQDPGPQADQGRAEFWEHGGGRYARTHFCSIEPWFIVGERYLVFVGEPVIARSYEHVTTIEGRANPGDKWLAYVAERLNPAPR